ncbi:hypothetical protein [Brevibacterium sp. RIT 803]|uniref:hypothetical protein n=1 Tax=Brevibacterium sp. RIT 803 TaxID=2810210 RepID=UPI0019524D5E|nr:hypothetical protein [Brevibacterium sp. RIT 803]MBM6588909.1 hypothetical protein [Brevibacterium sp. RIT 803]
MNDFTHRLAVAVESAPEADTEIVQFWCDAQLTLSIAAAIVNSEGLAALCHLDADAVGIALFTWEELETEWSAWRELGKHSPAVNPLLSDVTD